MSTNDFYQYCKTHHHALMHVNVRHQYLPSWLSKHPEAARLQGEFFPEVFLPDGTSIDLAGFHENAILIGEVKTRRRDPRARAKLVDFAESLAIREDLNPNEIKLFYLWTRGSTETAGLFSRKLLGKHWNQREIKLPEMYQVISEYYPRGNIHLMERAG